MARRRIDGFLNINKPAGITSAEVARILKRELNETVSFSISINVSIAEVDNHDVYQTADMGVAVAASDKAHADSQIQNVIRCIEQKAIVADIHVEYINV